MGLPQEDVQAPPLEDVQVSLLGRQRVQQQRTLAVAHYSHAALTLSAVDHMCVSYHLSDHRVNALGHNHRVNVFGHESVVDDSSAFDRANGFDVVLDRRSWQSGFGSVVLQVSLLLLADGVLLVCFSDVGL